MSQELPPKFWLLTYPRTASNLLTKILALEDQPNISPGSYFFAPTLRYRLGEFKTAGKHLDSWTLEQKDVLKQSYQACFESLQKHAQAAAADGKAIYVKEHAPWLMNPVAETEFVFGKGSTQEEPWMVQTSDMGGQTHSARNETVLPDEFLKTWRPTFLIRHPALVFPSSYRTCLDNEGPEVARTEPGHAMEMTMHWSRTMYEWFVNNLDTAESQSTAQPATEWPIIIDADDIMLEPEIVLKYSKIVGLDSARLKFAWTAAGDEELDKMSKSMRRMRSTIDTSTGIVEGKTAANLNIDEEVRKWREEFGEEEGRKMERWVRAAVPDYEYMRARRLRP